MFQDYKLHEYATATCTANGEQDRKNMNDFGLYCLQSCIQRFMGDIN